MDETSIFTLIELALRPTSRNVEARRDYDLHRLGDEWLVTKFGELELLASGAKPRVIAANLTAGRLHSVRRIDLGSVINFDQSLDEASLEDARAKVREFTAIRNSSRAPFFGALSFTAPPGKVRVFRHGRDVIDTALSHHIRIDASEGSDGLRLLSPGLDDADLRLIEIWRRGRAIAQRSDTSDSRKDRYSLLSLGYARLAEKLVLKFYESQQVDVSDISLTQLDQGAGLWRSCDILAAEHLAAEHIDVKNATSYGSRGRHAFVSKFKKVQSSDVLIAGVVSYPSSEFVANPRRRKKYDGGRFDHYVQQIFLGVTSVTRLNIIQNTINALPYRTQPLHLAFYERSLPPWAFEVPLDVDTSTLLRVAQLFSYEPTTIIAASLANGGPLSAELALTLNPAQREVLSTFQLVLDQAGYSKATIALFSLSEFVRWVVEGRKAAPLVRFIRKLITLESFVNKQRSFLASNSRANEKYELDIDFPGGSCGALIDPVNSIENLLHCLEECAEFIAESKMSFVHFDAPGPHILVGKDEGGNAVTLYAYCGGKLENGRWCNHFPLIITRNPPCRSCGRLICNECEFCTEGCREFGARKAASEATGVTKRDAGSASSKFEDMGAASAPGSDATPSGSTRLSSMEARSDEPYRRGGAD